MTKKPINDRSLVCASVQTPDYLVDILTTSCIFKTDCMNFSIEPLLALVIGILILLMPRFLKYFVALYLIVFGFMGLVNKSPT
jgi:hypothetical protein